MAALTFKNNNSIKADEGVQVFEFNNEHFGFLTKQKAYHHVGNINGEPFMISFCNTGVGKTPIVRDERLYFDASGLYDGLVLLGDTKTRSYWHQILVNVCMVII